MAAAGNRKLKPSGGFQPGDTSACVNTSPAPFCAWTHNPVAQQWHDKQLQIVFAGGDSEVRGAGGGAEAAQQVERLTAGRKEGEREREEGEGYVGLRPHRLEVTGVM